MIVTENQKYVGAFMSHSAFDQLLHWQLLRQPNQLCGCLECNVKFENHLEEVAMNHVSRMCTKMLNVL